jgi:hypothetical protein
MAIMVNGQNLVNDLSITTMTTTKAGLYLNPSSASPVLKTKINITLEPDFPYYLERDDFSVNATNLTNPSYYRRMNVIAADNDTKTITCMFGGAWSGDYWITIRHAEFGLLDTNGIMLTVGSNVTDIYPK